MVFIQLHHPPCASITEQQHQNQKLSHTTPRTERVCVHYPGRIRHLNDVDGQAARSFSSGRPPAGHSINIMLHFLIISTQPTTTPSVCRPPWRQVFHPRPHPQSNPNPVFPTSMHHTLLLLRLATTHSSGSHSASHLSIIVGQTITRLVILPLLLHSD